MRTIQWNSLVNSEQLYTFTLRFPIGKLWMHKNGRQHVKVLLSPENRPHISNLTKQTNKDMRCEDKSDRNQSRFIFIFSFNFWKQIFWHSPDNIEKKDFNLRKSLFLMTDIRTDIAGCLSVCRKYLIGQTWKRQNLIVVGVFGGNGGGVVVDKDLQT